MSIIKGGAAGFNSVVFYSENFKSKAIRKKDGKINIELSKRKITPNFEKLILRIPLIRGVFIFVKPVIVMWKFYLIVYLLLLFLLLSSGEASESASDSSMLSTLLIMANLIFNHFWLLIAAILSIFAIIIKLSNLGKYHGAEHMTDASFNSLSSLAISDVVKQSRIHNHCGTNFVVFLFVTYFIFSFFFSHFVVLIVLSICLGYEVFHIQSRILAPFYWVGGFFQYFLFTSKPSTEHLEVAIASYEAVIRAERDYKKVSFQKN
ncbi:DUF1385 domain-containing protein [Bacillus circulans]|uniref:DUF1385 domain-containing protein n=1 Tax=Niallia circulans TaxID=1397 RepID=UPI0015601126|nr:DUF1385 domain-containing protein [Niallia circulans]NRG25606.1 DUF1385 domain-containing protein [Niallia circulans]